MKIVFMGTPEFSVKSLEAILANNYEVPLVLTMPDKTKGRGYELSFSPVKKFALENNIEILQAKSLKDEDVIKKLKEVAADVFVVVAYGKILPKEVLEIPKKACINIHASLLPEYRGAAPIQWALLEGKEETGISTMLMDEGLDSGDILKRYILKIENTDTSASLFEKLAILGASSIIDTLKNLDFYILNREKQDEKNVSFSGIIKKEDGLLDFSLSAKELENRIRAYNPWPSSYSYLEGKLFKIWEAKAISEKEYKELLEDEIKEAKLLIKNKKLYVFCKNSALEILTLQVEGKKRMSSKEFLLGYNFKNLFLGR